MTEKVKTVIEFYFLLPDFKSRGHPSCGTIRSSKTKAEMFWDQIMIDKPEVFGEENPFNELIKRAQKDAFGLNEC